MEVQKSLAMIMFSLLVVSHTVVCYDKKQIKRICKRLPHPGPCEFFLSQGSSNSAGNLTRNPLAIFLKVTQEQASHGLNYTSSLGSRCKNLRERTAWSDCLQLHELTIEQLKKIISLPCTSLEKQTWLSAALTNLETCRQGFQDLGVTSNVLPLISNNASFMISNCLALNKVPKNKTKTSFVEGFPEWVTPGDRRLLQSSSSSADVVVAQDGSGNYKTVSQAVAAASGNSRFVIHVKAGTYNENVEIKKDKVMLVGDGVGKTIITGSKSFGSGSTTFRSATVAVTGDGFIAQKITFRNTAGPENHQAVAFRSGSDLSVHYQCSFEGYQDTLYTYTQRQFYKSCDIYGTVDFIFGNAAVVIQSSNIYARNPPKDVNTITAQGRTDPNQNTGISIHACTVTGSGLSAGAKTYLGRPWKEYSRTVFAKSELGSLIDPAGWLPWSGSFALDTLYYGEYGNTGPGSSTAKRVSWKGYHAITSASVASQFTVDNFIVGGSWIPATGVPYTSGL